MNHGNNTAVSVIDLVTETPKKQPDDNNQKTKLTFNDLSGQSKNNPFARKYDTLNPERNTKTTSFQKYPSNDSLNIYDSPKMIPKSKVSLSQESLAGKIVSVCSIHEIEKKRQEALKRRQSKLKLKKK